MSTGRRPSLKLKARSLMRQKTALALVGKGRSLTSIATEIGISVQSIRKHLRKALETESLFPSSLDNEQVGHLRQIEGERLTNLWQQTQSALDQLQPRLGSKTERNMDMVAVARLIEAGTRVSERLANLFGLNVPQKAIIETFSVNLERSEKKITISFDAGALEPPSEPIPGLSVWRNGQLMEGPGTESAELEPGFGPFGNVVIADAPGKSILGDPDAFSQNGR
jgi:hypothetical protein